MGVYIKGKNIPYGCAVCPCHNWEQGFCQAFDDFRTADDDQTRPDWCPLVEVHDHGDLIDAHSLKIRLGQRFSLDKRRVMEIVRETVDTAKVVIPADKEEV